MPADTFPQLRGSEFFSVNDVPLAAFRVATETSFRHSHDFYELVLVTKGQGKHQLFLPSGEELASSDLAQGDLISIPLGWSHFYFAPNQLEIFNVIFASEILEKWRDTLTEFSIFSASAETPTKWTLQRGEFEYLETLFQNVARETLGRQRGFGVAAEAKLAEALVWIERLNLRSNVTRSPDSEMAVSKVIAFMEQNFARQITLDEIARTAHLSTNYFCEVFKNATGQSPGRYLLRLRLEHARYLLLTTTRPITQVALESGFADASYFARAFKSAFGTAPTRLRAAGR
ncbi:helix-turn-helix domain-containing protein [bacterium]|nr:MAG: helix-turn-helix domain-containing protein [bacterium]